VSDYIQESYRRGDLSGIVIDMGDDMVSVRFLDSSSHPGVVTRCRMVVRADGSLGIDPSGLPVRGFGGAPYRRELSGTFAELAGEEQPALPAPEDPAEGPADAEVVE
jgi:hypothetical protein